MFLKMFWWRAQIFLEMKEEGEVSSVNIYFLDNLLRSHCLFEILQTSITVENSENTVKGGCFERTLRWRVPTFSRNE